MCSKRVICSNPCTPTSAFLIALQELSGKKTLFKIGYASALNAPGLVSNYTFFCSMI